MAPKRTAEPDDRQVKLTRFFSPAAPVEGVPVLGDGLAEAAAAAASRHGAVVAMEARADGSVAVTATPVVPPASGLPSMALRSRAEVVFAAHILSLLGVLSKRNLIEVLLDGDHAGKVDAGYRSLPGLPVKMLGEYDPWPWHDDARLGGDLRKTQRMLDENPDAIVFRVRINAPVLPIQHDRLVILQTDERGENHARIAAQLGKLLAPHIPGPIGDRLLAATGARDKRAEDVAHRVLLQIDSDYKAQLEVLEEVVGEDASRYLLCVHGVKTRLGKCVSVAERLVRPPYNVKSLQTFVCNGVASKFDEPEALFAVLDRLLAPPYNVMPSTA